MRPGLGGVGWVCVGGDGWMGEVVGVGAYVCVCVCVGVWECGW